MKADQLAAPACCSQVPPESHLRCGAVDCNPIAVLNHCRSCAGGKVSPWFSGAPASRLTAPAIEFKDAMVSYKKACNNYKQDPAASPTAKAGSLDAAGSSSKAATSTGKAAVEPSTAQSAQGSAAAPTTGQICRPSSSPVLTVVRGTAPTGVTAGMHTACAASNTALQCSQLVPLHSTSYIACWNPLVCTRLVKLTCLS